jgi:hypothetical protein
MGTLLRFGVYWYDNMRRNASTVIASLTLGLLFNFFFYGQQLGIAFFIYCGLLLSITFYLLTYYRHKISTSLAAVACLVLFFSAMAFVRASGFLTLLNVAFVLYLLLLIVSLARMPQARLNNYASQDYVLGVLQLPFRFIGEFINLATQLISSGQEIRQSKHSTTPVIRGVLLSLPFLFIFLILFSSADLVFKKYIGSLFDFQLSEHFIVRSLLVLFVASLFAGAYSLILGRTAVESAASKKPKKISLGSVESTIILGSVAFLFLIFIAVQIAYLFGGQEAIEAAGFTYSEYARKGFFELITVAVISLLLIRALNSSSKRTTLKERVVFMWLCGLLIFEVLFIMFSAHKRLGLYEQAYGFTTLRLYSHIFIGWLALVFTILLVHIGREQSDNKLAFQVFIGVAATMAVVNLMNPDAFIAEQNIQRLRDTGKIDVLYITRLSEDATPAVSKLLQDPNDKISNAIAHELYAQKNRRDAQKSDWQSFNLSRSTAKRILADNNQKIESNRDYQFSPNELDGY